LNQPVLSNAGKVYLKNWSLEWSAVSALQSYIILIISNRLLYFYLFTYYSYISSHKCLELNYSNWTLWHLSHTLKGVQS